MAAWVFESSPAVAPQHPPAGPTHWLGGVYVLLLAFPYVQWVPIPSYTQPVHLLVGGLLLLLSMGLVWRLHWTDAIGAVGLAWVGLALFSALGTGATDAQALKYLLSFVSPLLLGVTAWQVVRSDPARAAVLLRWSMAFWCGVSLLQATVSPTLGTGLLGQWGAYAGDIAASGRGVLGLAPEPTHHAFHVLVLAAAMVLLDPSPRGRRWAALGVFEAVVLAGSSSAILVLGLALCVWFVRYRLGWSVLLLAVVVLGWPWWPTVLALPLGTGSRAYALLLDLMVDPLGLLVADLSVNMRLGGLWATLYDIFANGFVPRGMAQDTWEATRQNARLAHPWLADISGNGPPSGLGMLVYQAGCWAVLPVLFVFRRVLQLRGQSAVAQVLLLAMPLVFLSQFYLSSPAFALLYGAALHRKWSVPRHTYGN